MFISISEKNHETFPVLSATQNKGMISRNDVGIDIKYDVNSLKTYKLVRKDQFVIHLRSFQGGFAHSAIDGITSPAYTILDFKDKRIHSPLFWREIFKSDFFIKRLESVIYGIRDGRSINYDEFLKLNFNYPSFEEQTQIGNFFKQLDDTIALHQRTLEKYQKLKVSYLEKMFPKGNERYPELRFPNSTDAWEQRKLGDLAHTFIGGGTPATNNIEFWDGSIPWLQSSDLIEDIVFNIIPRKFISKKALKKSATKLIPSNSITIVTRVGVGKLALIPYEFATSQDFISFSELKLDLIFASYAFYRLMKEESKSTQGTSIKGITKEVILNKYIYVPKSKEEQTQIGNFFKQLDDTIALHQRELEKFKILKTSYLEHIFLGKVSLFTAKNTITWEQRKLGEVVERITRKNLNLESRLPLTISAQDGLISQTEFFDKQVASKNISGYYLIENGEFAYNKSYSNGYPWGAIKRLDKYKNGVLSTLYIVFNPIDVDSQFLVSYFDTTFWHSEIAEIAVEGARNHGLLNIPVMDFFRIKIKIPKSKEEQTQIGNFFKQLDDTIALHQKELAKYQQIKAACLEKMFVE